MILTTTELWRMSAMENSDVAGTPTTRGYKALANTYPSRGAPEVGRQPFLRGQMMTTMQIRGASLFVQVIGQGYPLLLMHGGPGLDHTSLLALQPLADQCTLIFYDHRCNGRSDGEPVSSMTFDNLTADAEALRQTLGFEKR